MVTNMKVNGIRAENYFASLLNQNGIFFEYVNDWYDFLVNEKVKVEVKSCQLSVKDGRALFNKYRPGRFDFTNFANRVMQEEEDVWVAFILNHDSQFILLGFVKAKELDKKRYIPSYDIRKLHVASFEQWVRCIQ